MAVGDQVEVADVTRPGVKLSATVSRTSGELDPGPGPLLVESDLDNREGKIVPGSFVRVTLFVQSDAVAQIPQGCLVMRKGKPWVAVLKDNNTVTFRRVDLDESDGRTILITSGVNQGQRLILNPGSTLSEGEHVQPLKPRSMGQLLLPLTGVQRNNGVRTTTVPRLIVRRWVAPNENTPTRYLLHSLPGNPIAL